MNPIQRTFLRSKHWEVFLLWIATGYFFRMAINTLVGNPPFASTAHAPDIFPVRLLQNGSDLVLYAWAYFTGSFFNSISPARFRVSSVGFFLGLASLLTIAFLPLRWGWTAFPLTLAVALVVLISYAYVVRFTSKTLVIAKAQEFAPTSDYTNEFLLAFFFPVGIWFLQPRINKLYAAHQCTPAAAGSVDSTTQLPAGFR